MRPHQVIHQVIYDDVERLLSVGLRNQRLYFLSQLIKQGLFDECIGIAYDAVVLSKVLYALSGWGGYINNNNNIHICIAPYGRNFRGAGPGSVLVGVRRGKRVSLGEEKCL